MTTVTKTESRSELRWWEALSPPIYLISLLPALTVLEIVPLSTINPSALLLGTLGVILLQHGINVLNDATDWGRNADVEKMTSWVRFHRADSDVARFHGRASWLAGGLIGLSSIYLANRWEIVLFAAPLVFLGYLYNYGRKPIAYSRHSEWVTGLCYGPGVFGGLWLLSRSTFSPAAGLGMAAYAALSVSVLLAHQPRQTLTDSLAGKASFAVRYGADRARQVSRLLFFASLILLNGSIFFAPTSVATRVVHTIVSIAVGMYFFRKAPSPPKVLGLTALCIVSGITAELFFAGVWQ